MRKVIIMSMLLALPAMTFASDAFLDKGTMRTLNELGASEGVIKNKLGFNFSKRATKFNSLFEKTFRFNTKPFQYFTFMTRLSIPEEKVNIIKDISDESGKYLIAAAAIRPTENFLTVSELDRFNAQAKDRSRKMFALRYLYILKGATDDYLISLKKEYKSEEYQVILKETISRVTQQIKLKRDIIKKKKQLEPEVSQKEEKGEDGSRLI